MDCTPPVSLLKFLNNESPSEVLIDGKEIIVDKKRVNGLVKVNNLSFKILREQVKTVFTTCIAR